MARTIEQKAKMAEYQRNYLRRKTEECFAAYGGYECTNCGETDPLVLTIDHINGEGPKPVKKIRPERLTGQVFYAWLSRRGFPQGFRVLCANCQLRHLKGVI